MIVLLVLFCSLLVFRALGFLGVPLFATLKGSTVFALAIMFCFTGFAHFGQMRTDLEKMVPAGRPATPLWIRGPVQLLFILLIVWVIS